MQNNSTATWCTVSIAEQSKCDAFSQAIDQEKTSYGNNYISIKCKQAFNKEECMTLLDQEKADLTTLDPGEVFVGGRYHSLVPVMQEIYDSGVSHQYAVAVIKKGSLTDVYNLAGLRGKKACFAGVGTLAGWIAPIHNVSDIFASRSAAAVWKIMEFPDCITPSEQGPLCLYRREGCLQYFFMAAQNSLLGPLRAKTNLSSNSDVFPLYSS